MAEHTPGPWNIDGTEHITENNGTAITIKAGCETIAWCPLADDVDETTWADARLIAAAPELLAACIQAREAIRDNLKMYVYKNEPLLMQAFDRIQAAVKGLEPPP